jgi:hypothetical protein
MGKVISGWFVFVWGMRWKIGLWWCMIKQMNDGNYEVP